MSCKKEKNPAKPLVFVLQKGVARLASLNITYNVNCHNPESTRRDPTVTQIKR